jgi:hypothetical protein
MIRCYMVFWAVFALLFIKFLWKEEAFFAKMNIKVARDIFI